METYSYRLLRYRMNNECSVISLDEINMIPLYEMSEVPKFMSLYPAHRTLAPDRIGMSGGDISISNQQYVVLSSWMNADE